MKALVFHKPKDVRVEKVDDPRIEHPGDVILRVTSTAICGSDLHIYNGMFPQPRDMVLGHEFMGIVEEVGSEVKNIKKGNRIVVPFPIACGQCRFCKETQFGHCENSNVENYGPEGGILEQKGAAIFGYTDLYGGYNGGQAEYVRVPYADIGPRVIQDDLTDEQVLFLTDIFPTGWAAVDWANLKGGETVAIFGAGPVGLMAAKSAWLKGAGRVIIVDVLDYRLEMAKKAANVETINADKVDVVEVIRSMTNGYGADVCIDAVGMEPERNIIDRVASVVHMEKGSIKVLKNCFSAVRRAGTVTVVGVYGTTYDNFPWSQFFDKGLTLRAGQAPVHKYIDELLMLVRSGKVVLNDIITHRLPLDKAADAYDIFRNKEDNCVKVVLKPGA